ncbi:hypothetical protein [Dactylosporangium sp. NPDC006015]|uniref:hypothetical protein n=1 Tax=Dactylosporangium sp. NPDC006015 TaxID=3154576 RepID=UPI0033A0F8C9
MPSNVMIVLSNTRPEVEDEFNAWYSDVHVHEVVDELDGFATAQRFKLADQQVEEGATWKYLVIYTIPEGRLADAQAAIRAQRAERAEALAAGRKPWISARSDLFDGKHHSWFFTAITDEIAGRS